MGASVRRVAVLGAPNAPLDQQKPANPNTPWPGPIACNAGVITDPVCAQNPASSANANQVLAHIHDMNTNINAAHAAGLQVILTSDHFPKWLTDPTSNTEPSITAPNAVFPADRVLMLSRLQASDRRNPPARALQEYGRLIKTNWILTWLADEQPNLLQPTSRPNKRSASP